MPVDFNVMVGGEAGQGVQSVGAILAGALAEGGFGVFADQDYESRVRGGHNFFRIRAKAGELSAISPGLDMLVALNKETVELHKAEMNPGGVILYDAATSGITEKAKNYFDVPFTRLAEEKGGNKIMSNTVAAAAALGLIDYDFNILSSLLEKEFARHGEKTVKDNIAAARAGFDYARENGKSYALQPIHPLPGKAERLLINGNDALAIGALAAGCKFAAGYPMTPSSSILEYIAEKGLTHGAVMVHTEDEISAMNMAVGAGYTGVRAMVATSGGGFALMVEGLALAGMTETPVVAVLGQRPGPATGLPTRTEQAELFFALHAGHGEFPRAVLTPFNAAGAFRAAVNAFNLAEKYQTPVLILTDHHLASSYATVDKFDFSKVSIERGALVNDTDMPNPALYKRHAVTAAGVSPRALPGFGKALAVTDSDEHNESGHMIEDAATRNQQVEKRNRKLDGLQKEVTPPEFHASPGAAVTLIGWGSTYGAIREAAALLAAQGKPVNTLNYSQVWPFPAAATLTALKITKKNIAVEGNSTGQLSQLIRRETGVKAEGAILKYDGRPFTPTEIIERLNREVKPW
jgi:2-oxoglutarate/2-oxoacid ferredoxin oxidoreductase subunit alpha